MENDIYDILVEEYGLTPDQVDDLMELGVLAGEQGDIIPRQQQYADELRGTPSPRGRRYGGVYESAHPLEFLGSGMQQIAGHIGEAKAKTRQEEILKEQAERRGDYLRRMSTSRPSAAGPMSMGSPNSFSGAPVPTKVPWNEAPVLSMQGNRWNR